MPENNLFKQAHVPHLCVLPQHALQPVEGPHFDHYAALRSRAVLPACAGDGREPCPPCAPHRPRSELEPHPRQVRRRDVCVMFSVAKYVQ